MFANEIMEAAFFDELEKCGFYKEAAYRIPHPMKGALGAMAGATGKETTTKGRMWAQRLSESAARRAKLRGQTKKAAYRPLGALTGMAKRMGGGAAQKAKKKMTGLGRTTYSSLAPKKAVSGFSRL